MIEITEITDSPKQLLQITLEDNQVFDLEISYNDNVQAWFITHFEYQGFILNNFRIITSANILRVYQNTIPIGIAVSSGDLSEPLFIDDFQTGRIKIFVLTEDEVKQVETDFFKQP